METKPQGSSASLWDLESVGVSLGKVAVLCPLVAWEKKIYGEIDAFVTSVAQEKPSKYPAATAAILCLILALKSTEQRARRTVLSETRGSTCGQCGLVIPCYL